MFENIDNPETIAAISAGIATILGAFGAFIKKIRKRDYVKAVEEGLTLYQKLNKVFKGKEKDKKK